MKLDSTKLSFKIIISEIFYHTDISYTMGSLYKPNEAKLRRIQAITQFSNSENIYKMKPDSHGKCNLNELDSSFNSSSHFSRFHYIDRQ